ncbi:hypothetical protein BGZ65_003438 [Modicella reniformis]|uniref:F-box domain-containing protein n=1 Tax=Modicella reniformis TaxID=1440133 RepID=A0A9P6LSQ5_9FUNG|nr:hypothetical protein BGZ65_003438 [Modicella reniformis]
MVTSSTTTRKGLPAEVWLLVAEYLNHKDLLHCVLVGKEWHAMLFMNLWRSVNVIDFDYESIPPELHPFGIGRILNRREDYNKMFRANASHIRHLTVASIWSLKNLGPDCTNLLELHHLPCLWSRYHWENSQGYDQYRDLDRQLRERGTSILVELIGRNPRLKKVRLQLPDYYSPLAIVDALSTRKGLKSIRLKGSVEYDGDWSSFPPNVTSTVLQRIVLNCKQIKCLSVDGNIRESFHNRKAQGDGEGEGERDEEPMAGPSELESLNLCSTYPHDSVDMTAILPHVPKLGVLGLPCAMMPNQFDEMAQVLIERKCCPMLHSITLKSYSLKVPGVINFLLNAVPQLRDLRLIKCLGFRASVLKPVVDRHTKTLQSIRIVIPDMDPHPDDVPEAVSLLSPLSKIGSVDVSERVVYWQRRAGHQG